MFFKWFVKPAFPQYKSTLLFVFPYLNLGISYAVSEIHKVLNLDLSH